MRKTRIMPQNRLLLERPRGLMAGFACRLPEERRVPELAKVGEQWAPPGFAIPGHMHPRWEFYLQTSGATEWSAGRRRWHVREGGLLAVPPGTAHALLRCRDERHAFMFAEIDLAPVLERLPALAPAWNDSSVFMLAEAARLRSHFARLVHEAVTPEEWRPEALRLALDSLLVEITRARRGDVREPLPQTGHAGIGRAKMMLEQHPADPWREADLARIAGLSPAHFREVFLRENGTTPRRFLEALRIEQASRLLLESDLSITEIAHDCGFSSSQHFARVFSRLRGKPPRVWRRRGSTARQGTPSVRLSG
jgi:AraC-like DNA-binding protein